MPRPYRVRFHVEIARTGIYFNLQELRALADFILDEIAPNDRTATPAQLAEAHYYRGMAYLLLAENFVAVPIMRDAEPTSNVQLLERALQELTAASRRRPKATSSLRRARRWRAPIGLPAMPTRRRRSRRGRSPPSPIFFSRRASM